MSLADSVKAGMEQLRQAQAKVIESYGGNPPPEVTKQFQELQEKMAGTTEWVQKLSDQAEEAKAKAQSLTQSALDAQVEDEGDGTEFEAYPWQFEKEHALGPVPSRELVQSLLADDEEPQKPPTLDKRPTLSKPPATSHDLSEQFSSPTDIAPNWDTLDLPD